MSKSAKINKKGKHTSKTARIKTPRYFAYLLSVGRVEYVENKRGAKTFERENSDIIVDTIKFFTRKEYNNHKTQKHIATPTKSTGVATVAKPSLAVSTRTDKVKSLRYFDSKDPCSTLLRVGAKVVTF